MEKASIFVASGGVIVPLIFGIIGGMILQLSLEESIVIGLILIATSVGVTVRTLMDINALDTDVGATILGSAVIDDVIGIIILAIFLGTDPVIYVGIKIVIFFVIFLYIGLHIIDKILDLGEKIHLPKAFLSISLSIFLLYTFFSQSFGIAGIIGAFVAGLIIGHTIKYRKIIDDVETIGYGLFIPLFFVWVGASLWNQEYTIGLSSLPSILLIAVVIIIIAIFGKILGCGIGAKLAGLRNRQSLQIGIGMIPRMELALIIVTSAIAHGKIQGQIAHHILIATILLTLTTTLLTPLFIKAVFTET